MAEPTKLALLINYLCIFTATPFLIPSFFFDVFRSIFPGLRQHKGWSFKQAVGVRLVQVVLQYWTFAQTGDRLSLKPGKEGNRFEVFQTKEDKFYVGAAADKYGGTKPIKPQPLGVTWTPARPPKPQIIKPSLVVALHFHGGGFVVGNGRDEDAGYSAKILKWHIGCTHVCSVQYRLASHNDSRFPAALQDAITAYVHLLEDLKIPASQIIFTGDSAGANLALQLVRYIDENKSLGLPFPAALTLWSPWIDPAQALTGKIRESPNFLSDYINGGFGKWGIICATENGLIDPSDPYFSPLQHPFQPSADIPMFVQGGSREVLFPDIEEFVKQFRKQGWNLCYHLTDGGPHDIFLLGEKLGFEKETEAAAHEARDFLLKTTSLQLQV